MAIVDVLELRWIEFGVIAERPEDFLIEVQRQWTVDHRGSASENGHVHLAEDSLVVLADPLSVMYSNQDLLAESILLPTVTRVAHTRVDAVLIEFHRRQIEIVRREDLIGVVPFDGILVVVDGTLQTNGLSAAQIDAR